jgi:hypothetical protein
MADESRKWHKQTFRLPDNLGQLGLAVKPGYNVFIADRGAVGFCYPRDWIVRPHKDCIGIHDREPPDDDCALRVSVLRLPPVKVDWKGLPLSRLIRETTRRDRRGVTSVGEVVSEDRPEYQMAWGEVRFIDPKEKRPARSRVCMARANLVQPLITFDFWETELPRCAAVWDEVLATLKVGVELPGPPRGDWN